MYSTLVESLKRLYSKGRVTKTKLQDMVKAETITQEEYDYITSAE